MKKVPFFLVTGFLGSGKTTFLKRILEKTPNHKKTAIIQNEFAPASIDGVELKRGEQKFELLEVNNGSVFCVCLLSDFISSLEEFVIEHQPDQVFLEASGLSDPIAIAQILQSEALQPLLYLEKVWTIIDAKHFSEKHKLITSLQHQLRIADVVILNKTDLVDEERIQLLKEEIKVLNPMASISPSSYCKLSPEEWSEELQQTAVAIKNAKQNAAVESCGRPPISAGVLKSSRKISRAHLEQFIDKYSEQTIRIKGFAKLENGEGISVQTSFQEKTYTKVDHYPGGTLLIAMGAQFNLSEFSKDYRKLAL